MHRVVVVSFLSLGIFLSDAYGFTVDLPRAASITVILRFDGDQSETTIAAMKREVKSIMTIAGTTVEFEPVDGSTTPDTPGALVVVRFKGSCRMEDSIAGSDERGPLAFTHTVNGEVLPFSEVE